MYHMGVIKALIENGAMPGIISGTSGGSIVVGVLGIHSDQEMLEEVIADDIAVRYPERWFPPIAQQLYSYLKHGCLVEHDSFAACCKAYPRDWTNPNPSPKPNPHPHPHPTPTPTPTPTPNPNPNPN